MVDGIVLDPKLFVLIKTGLHYGGEQDNPSNQPDDVNAEENTSTRLFVGDESGKIWETHVVAESVNDKRCNKVTSSDKKKRGVNAEN